jgi:hypothetical protein
MMLINLLKRVLPFILTLIFGIGLGSIFSGGSPRTPQVAPNFTPPAQTYKGCGYKRRNFNSSTPSQTEQSNPAPTRSEPTTVR